MKRKIETARRAYIRLLSKIATSADSSPTEQRDAILCGELIEGGYLDGAPVRGHGGIVAASVTGISAKGRLFLQQLEAEQRDKSILGRAKKFSFFAGGVVVGVFASVLADLVKSWLHLKP